MDVYAVLGLALINKAKGNYKEAIESLEGLTKSDPKNHRLYIEIAECYISLKDNQKAIGVLMDFQKLGLRDTQISQMLEQLRFGAGWNRKKMTGLTEYNPEELAEKLNVFLPGLNLPRFRGKADFHLDMEGNR